MRIIVVRPSVGIAYFASALALALLGFPACGARSELCIDCAPGAGDAAGGAGAGGAPVSTTTGHGGYPPGCDAEMPGPPMLEVTFLSGEAYCIDTTEVTVGDYAAFLESKPGRDGLPPECDGLAGDTFVPAREWPPEPEVKHHPITWVDFCDAWAYCAWAGKRLCGKKGGGANSQTILAPEVDEWINACTRSGERVLPYGDRYDPEACNVASEGVEDVGSRKTCEGGFEGIFDLVGNVSEWTNDCGTDGACHMLGDSWTASDVGAGCASNLDSDRLISGGFIGFRCCRDAE